MQQTCHEVLNELGITNEPLLELAIELERIALEDEYFVVESCILMWTSIQELFFKALESQLQCSRSYSPLLEQSVGYLSGKR